ncbi:MAG: hypothetical protein HZC17_04075 [Candidatus Omnitrophica bacterium]|nr:hypothetical protein [Candidatus Omnitrophota bacterium]
MVFVFKVLISGIIIAFSSWLAGRKPVLAGFIVALPLISILSILFSYLEYRDMEKVNQFAASIFLAVPLSLSFFIPFFLNRWLKMNFALTFTSALLCIAVFYLAYNFISKSGLMR